MTGVLAMRPYWAIFSARCRVLLQYRAAALAGCATQLFWGLIRMMIFAAFFRQSHGPHPMTAEQVTSYVWLGQAMLMLVMFGPDPDIRDMIRRGHVAFEFVRPLHLYGHWYSRATANRAAALMLRMPPILAIAYVCFGLQLPASPLAGGLWLVATVSGVLLAASVSMLLTISLLWTISGEGINRLAPALMFIASGIVVPLPLFPEFLQPVLKALPFRGLADTPYRLYLGDLRGVEGLWAIGQQVAWTAGLVAVGVWLIRRAGRRVVIQGG